MIKHALHKNEKRDGRNSTVTEVGSNPKFLGKDSGPFKRDEEKNKE